MELKFSVLLIFIIHSVAIVKSRKVSSAMVRTCCSIGTESGKRGDCTGKPVSQQTDPKDAFICKASWKSCCLQEKQRQSCRLGVGKAMRMKNCSDIAGGACGATEKLCCSYCKFGFEFAVVGHDCLSIPKNSPHDIVSRMCCSELEKNKSMKDKFAKGRLEKGSLTKNTCTDLRCSHKCKDTDSGPYCICPAGYKISFDGINCLDIDECKENSSICSLFNTCFNTAGSYYCSRKPKCGDGYELSGSTCIDINECERQPKICGSGSCLNQQGSYFCRCDAGFMFNTTTKKCQEYNPCDTVSCEYKCENLGRGRYRCLCPKGKALNADRRTCREFDPCENHRCQHKCKPLDDNRYRCICPKGYQINSDGMTCKVNTYKITLEVQNIDPIITYKLQWNERSQKKVMNIPTSRTTKKDLIFESAIAPQQLEFKLFDMKDRLIKINGKESFRVIPHLGKIDVRLQVGQNDDNPCRTDPCSQNCENLGGRRYRCTCRSGYEMKSDGRCVVIRDPCKNKPCQYNCYNMGRGQFFCTCPAGQKLNEDKRTCKVTDPCLYNGCQWKCTRDGDKAKCLCPRGYRVEGTRCKDIDECQSGTRCDSRNYDCFNTYGSYKCIPKNCPKRYFKPSGDKYCYKDFCKASDTECKNDKVQSYQWMYSKLVNNLPRDYARYYYRLYKPSFNHYVTFKIVSGNEDGAFYLKRDNDYQVTIMNQKKLVGPKDYKLSLVSSVYKDGVLHSQLVTLYYIYVSAHGLY